MDVKLGYEGGALQLGIKKQADPAATKDAYPITRIRAE